MPIASNATSGGSGWAGVAAAGNRLMRISVVRRPWLTPYLRLYPETQVRFRTDRPAHPPAVSLASRRSTAGRIPPWR